MSQKVVLHLCSECEGPGWAALQDALSKAALTPKMELRPVACMNACGSPVTLALQGEGRATCVFSGVDPERDASDIVATVQAYIEAPDGWIEDARACGRLRHCLRARVPAL